MRAKIKDWVEAGLTVVKIGTLLTRMGVEVPHRTLARFCVERCGTSRKNRVTVRVTDPGPGQELQVAFGRLGLVPDGEKKRVCNGLVFTVVNSGRNAHGRGGPPSRDEMLAVTGPTDTDLD